MTPTPAVQVSRWCFWDGYGAASPSRTPRLPLALNQATGRPGRSRATDGLNSPPSPQLAVTTTLSIVLLATSNVGSLTPPFFFLKVNTALTE